MQGQLQGAQANKRDWRYHFQHSTYIGVMWDWFLVLSAKLADPFLLLSILYAGFKVTNPDLASRVWPGIDAAVNIGQNIALDAAGFGLLAMAAQAEKDENTRGATRARIIGYTLLGMMIVNMGLASLARSFNWQEQDYAWLIGLLLIARAVLSVAYGVVSRSLRKHETETGQAETVNAVSVLERVEQVEGTLRDFERTYQRQLDILTEINRQLQTLRQTRPHLTQTETPLPPPPQEVEGSMYLLPPTKRAQRRAALAQETPDGFNKKQFVFDCLREHPAMKISEIRERAARLNQTLSVGTISTYRKEYSETHAASTPETDDVSSATPEMEERAQ